MNQQLTDEMNQQYTDAMSLKFIDGMTRKEFKKMVWLIITTFDIGAELKSSESARLYDFIHDLKGIVCEPLDGIFSPRYEGQKIVDMSRKYGIMPQTFDAVDMLLEQELTLPVATFVDDAEPTTILDLLCFISKSGDLRDKFVQLCQELLDEVIVTREDTEHILDKQILLQL